MGNNLPILQRGGLVRNARISKLPILYHFVILCAHTGFNLSIHVHIRVLNCKE